MFWHRVNEDSPLPTFLAPIKTSTTCCSVGSDAQTLSLLFWASLSDHTAEGLRVTGSDRQRDVIPYSCGLLDCISYRMILRKFKGVPARLI